MEEIVFRFDGGIADNAELNFYESGRFAYGAARLIYTLERFRQERRVVERLTRKVNADIRIRAAERGSFVQNVLLVATPLIFDCVIQVSFQALFAHAWNLLLPPSRGQDAAVDIAKEFVKLEQYPTEQMRIMADVANNNNATTQQALEVLSKALSEQPDIASKATLLSSDQLKARQNEIESYEKRREITRPYESELAKITPEEERKLTAQLRNPVGDLGLPL